MLLEKLFCEIFREDIEWVFDLVMVIIGYEEFIDMVKFYKNEYDWKFIGLMN